ncbi:uncharacterized protein LOC111332076 [Stylophora pistillata]|uniref:uncharacterized protein LOC111332076 n=1 Tax=Stylophora pistillata TaxID=50429 RepID=UPI000C04EC2A|nr:uncharacterized protein LOC111332076 [Stylophora pistillata]
MDAVQAALQHQTFSALIFALGVNSASVGLSSTHLTLNGNAHILFYGPEEAIWAGLSNGRRYPIINSGDRIALRSANRSGDFVNNWMRCTSSNCKWYTCPGQVINSSAWSSCSSNMFYYIHAMGKMDGQPINSGDVVSLSSRAFRSSYRLFCGTSSSSKCYMSSTISSLTGNSWFYYNSVTFQIFSRHGTDGTPVQYGDIVAFKYPYASRSAWLYYYSGFFYPRSCSANRKSSCAAENLTTAFKIFKKL